MTMTSTESGLPFPLKKGHIRPGSASADRGQIKGPGSQQEGVNDRESLSMEAVRDYGDEVYHIVFLPSLTSFCNYL